MSNVTQIWQHDCDGELLYRVVVRDGQEIQEALCVKTEPDIPDDAMLEDRLKISGRFYQTLELNPEAALQKAIAADFLSPASPEYGEEYGGKTYLAQVAEHLGTGERRVYYVIAGEWDNVWWLLDD